MAGQHARDAHDELVAFPPEAREVQLGEKWSFAARKQANCDPGDPADDHRGDWWDHVAYYAEHRLVLAVVPGARSIENAEEIVAAVHDRTGGRPDSLLTSDEYPAYETAIDHVYGIPEPKPPGTPGRPPVVPGRRVLAGLSCAKVHEEREKGRVVAIAPAVVLGAWRAVAGALERSGASRTINTSSVERHHLTDRHHNPSHLGTIIFGIADRRAQPSCVPEIALPPGSPISAVG